MKKFVGNVNGKEFNDIDEFTKAVNDAIESNESPMMISSYYTECDCDDCDSCDCEKKSIENKNEKKPLDVDTILLKRDSEKSGDIYKVPVNAKELFDNASNIDEIKDEIKSKISANNKEVSISNLQIGNFNKKIDEYNNKIKSWQNNKNEAESQLAYYNTLINIIDGTEDVEALPTNEENEEDENPRFFASDSLRKNEKAMDIICDVLSGFDKYLKDIGFWRR